MKTDNKYNLPFDQLVVRLKNEDNNYANLTRAFMIVYFILIPFLAVSTFFSYRSSHELIDLIWGLSNISAFLIFIFLFRSYHKEYSSVNYAAPTLQMLKAAAYRYKPFQRKTIWAFVALIFVYIGFVANFQDEMAFWKSQLIFLGLMVLAVCVGLLLWYFKYRPIRKNALRLIKELENEE